MNFIFDFTLHALIVCLLFFSIGGLGYGFSRLIFPNFLDFQINHIWLGICLTMALSNAIHYLSPIDWSISLAIFGFGGVVAVYYIIVQKSVLDALRNKLCDMPATFKIILPIFFVVLLFKSLDFSRNYDTGLYHFNSIRWINEYPLVGGLALLHDRLAFNSSWFQIPALLNFYPYFSRGHAVSLLFLSFACAIGISVSIFSARKKYKIISIIFFIALIVSSSDLTTPSPDPVISVFQLVVSLILLEFIFDKNNKIKKLNALLFFIIFATLLTVKLSSIIFFGIFFLFFVKEIWSICDKNEIFIFCILSLIVLLLHFGRGYFLSGAPFYPNSFLAIYDLRWSVSDGAMKNTSDAIFCWARLPGENCLSALNGWGWVAEWWRNFYVVAKLLILGSIIILLGCILLICNYILKMEYIFVLKMYGLTFMGLFVWFFLAPDPRFLGSMPYLLVSLSLLFLINVIDQYSSWASGAIIKIMSYSKVPIIIFFIYHYGISTISSIDSICQLGYQGVKSVDIVENSVKSGLVIYAPENGDRCMDSPIPCTPYINENLSFHDDGFFPRNYFMIEK